MNSRTCLAVWIVVLALAPSFGEAQSCDVPSVAHPTLQDAIDDTACVTVNLADLTYAESVLVKRSLTMEGPPALADIAGLVEVEGVGNMVELNNLVVNNGCTPAAMRVTEGGQVFTSRLEVVSTNGGPCPPSSSALIFVDGFESGNTSAWSGTQ